MNIAEHVWEVQVHRRGLAVEKNIVGSYHLCLTDKALRLAQTGSRITLSGEPRMPFVEFQLTTIRRYVIFSSETETNKNKKSPLSMI